MGFNALRNSIAHNFVDLEGSVVGILEPTSAPVGRRGLEPRTLRLKVSCST